MEYIGTTADIMAGYEHERLMTEMLEAPQVEQFCRIVRFGEVVLKVRDGKVMFVEVVRKYKP